MAVRVLPQQQRAVLVAMANGLSVGETARRLCLAPATIKSHRRLLYRRLGARCSAHAVATAIRVGLLDVADVQDPAGGERP
ncbi:response regulator transcription factor [Streptomyces rimosus]|uniref:response regulator transcription factor n=1 Tax=Streptomyces rimosus TaxID=1927 RepID=UPI0004CAE98E|nr:LuxR C-terminal-related transcriptional regulator [Streptomyces rimosus]